LLGELVKKVTLTGPLGLYLDPLPAELKSTTKQVTLKGHSAILQQWPEKAGQPYPGLPEVRSFTLFPTLRMKHWQLCNPVMGTPWIHSLHFLFPEVSYNLQNDLRFRVAQNVSSSSNTKIATEHSLLLGFCGYLTT
jgi:hypothetical protein